MVGHCHPGHGGMALEEEGDQMLQQLLQVSLGMSSEWTRPALPKVKEWWSEYKLRL